MGRFVAVLIAAALICSSQGKKFSPNEKVKSAIINELISFLYLMSRFIEFSLSPKLRCLVVNIFLQICYVSKPK